MRKLTVRATGEYSKDRAQGKPLKLQIRLEGRWLSALGLRDGDRVCVYETQEGLTIKKEVQSEPK